MKIEIYDQLYNVNGEQNEEYLKELAAYVDGKMRTIAESTHMVDSLKVAVLAALNIADEMFTTRQKQQEIEGPAAQARGKMRGDGREGAGDVELIAGSDSRGHPRSATYSYRAASSSMIVDRFPLIL